MQGERCEDWCMPGAQLYAGEEGQPLQHPLVEGLGPALRVSDIVINHCGMPFDPDPSCTKGNFGPGSNLSEVHRQSPGEPVLQVPSR